MSIKGRGRPFAIVAAAAVVATAFSALPASATPAGDSLVINEINVASKFVELYNPTNAPITVDGSRIGYYSGKGNLQCVNNGTLTGTVPAKGHYLIQMASTAVSNNPKVDALWGCDSQIGANGGYALGDVALPATIAGDVSGLFTDFVGIGTHVAFETKATTLVKDRSITRTGGVDTNDNSADFSDAAATPKNSAGETADPDPTTPPTTAPPAGSVSIAEIQGTSDISPLEGKTVTTEGYVTAAYPTGGMNGVFIQTAGTGGGNSHTGASNGLFVYNGAAKVSTDLAIGDYATVTGVVSEFNGSTQLTASAAAKKDAPADKAAPKAIEFEAVPETEAGRESIEGMLVKVTGPMTITNNYQTHQFGNIGVAMGTSPLRQPTDVLNPTRDGVPAVQAIEDSNLAKSVTIDDGMTTNFTSATGSSTPGSWVTLDNEIRAGAAVTQTAPTIMEFRNKVWTLQNVKPMVGPTGADASAVSFDIAGNTRPTTSPNVGGDISISSFNVLNYFTTTAEEVGCTSVYNDREGNPITANQCGDVRGAATTASFERQQTKIVAAINKLDSSVVSLEEIENTVKTGKDRDYSVNQLVKALNADAGSNKWAAIPSAKVLPDTASQDVIRLAFIYQPAEVTPIGDSSVLVGDAAFDNARQPLAQTWQAVGKDGKTYGDDFVVVVNHFKSKSSGTDAPDKWQGKSNSDRVAQAKSVSKWVAQNWASEPVFIVGDLNAYSAEDPVLTLTDAGYTRIMDHMYKKTGKIEYLNDTTYQFQGLQGSLDQAFGNEAALKMVTDAGVYPINASELLGREYSRYNSNITNLYQPNEFRSSDHDPVKIGVNVDGSDDSEAPGPISAGDNVFFQDKLSTTQALFGMKLDINESNKVYAGDFNGNGVDTMVVRSNDNVYTFYDSNRTDAGTYSINLGRQIDGAMFGDFNGDGKDDIALSRWGTNQVFIQYNVDGKFSSGKIDADLRYGRAYDEVFVGDWDGNGTDGIGIYRDGGVFLRQSLSAGAADISYRYGNRVTDGPIVGDWDGDGKDTVSVLRDWNTVLINDKLAGGAASQEITFGRHFDSLIVGDWFGTGSDTLAAVRGIFCGC